MKDIDSIISWFSKTPPEKRYAAPACRVILANDDAVMRESIKQLFQGNSRFEVIEVTGEGGDALGSGSGLPSDIVVLDGSLIGRILTRGKQRGGLTRQQEQILVWITDGKTSREIADLLQLSARTVEHHRQTIKRKLGLKRTADLVKYCIEKRISANSIGETGNR